MRDRYEIKTEIDAVQEDLERNLHQLREVIAEKVDVKSKIEDKVEATKAQAIDYAARGKMLAEEYVATGKRFVREKPLVVAGIGAGVVLIGAAILAIRAKMKPEPPVTAAELRAALAELRARHDDLP